MPRLRLICFLCCLLKVITSCLEIYKRTAQGEPPPKGVGTEWKMRYTCGRRTETARVGGCRCETHKEKYFLPVLGTAIHVVAFLPQTQAVLQLLRKVVCECLSQAGLVEVQLPRSPPISSLLSQIRPGVSQPAAAEGRERWYREPVTIPTLPSLCGNC